MKSLGRFLVAVLLSVFVLSTPVYAQEEDPVYTLQQELQTLEFREHWLASEQNNRTPENWTRHRLPAGRRCIVSGVPFQCFTLDEYKELLYMDIDLSYTLQMYALSLQRANKYERVFQLMLAAYDEHDRQIEILQQERTRLFDRWSEENRLRLEAENRPMFGSWIAWGLAAVEGAIIGGMLLYGAIDGD